MTPNSPSKRNQPENNSPMPPIAISELTDRCMGNTSIAILLLEKFEAQIHRDIIEINAQLHAQNASELARVTHALKGAAGAVAAPGLHAAAARIEGFARQQQLASIRDGMASLQDEVQRCLDYLPVARRSIGGRNAPSSS